MKDIKVVVGFAMINTLNSYGIVQKYPKQQSTAWFYVFENKEDGQGYFKSVSDVLGKKFDNFICEIPASELISSVKKMREVLPKAVFEKVVKGEQANMVSNRYKIRLGVNIANIFSTFGLDDDTVRIRRAIEENDASLLFNVQRGENT